MSKRELLKWILTFFLLLFSFKLMAQYISHTLPLLKPAKPKKNHNTIILFGDNDHTVIAHLKKRLCSVRVSQLLFQILQFCPGFNNFLDADHHFEQHYNFGNIRLKWLDILTIRAKTHKHILGTEIVGLRWLFLFMHGWPWDFSPFCTPM